MQYRRNETISIQEIDNELFLADDSNGGIYHLNALGAGFWRALESPASLQAIIELFCAAFPDEDVGTLTKHITQLAEELEDQGLIVCEDDDL